MPVMLFMDSIVAVVLEVFGQCIYELGDVVFICCITFIQNVGLQSILLFIVIPFNANEDRLNARSGNFV